MPYSLIEFHPMAEQAERLVRQFEAAGHYDIARGISAWAEVARSRGIESFEGPSPDIVDSSAATLERVENDRGINYLALTRAMYDEGGIVLSQDQLKRAQRSLDTALETLHENDRRLLELRFGLRDGIGRTYDQVAGEMSISPNYIIHLKRRALARLAFPARREELDQLVLGNHTGFDLSGRAHQDMYYFNRSNQRFRGKTDTITGLRRS